MAATTAIREWPLIFSGSMVRAILSGAKTQTRRVVTWHDSTVLGYWAKPYWPNLLFDHAIPRRKSTLMRAIVGTEAAPPDVHLDVPYQHPDDPKEADAKNLPWYRVRPKWEIGDPLWVKESCWLRPERTRVMMREGADTWPAVIYSADREREDEWCKDHGWTRRNSIFCPREASRLTLEITDVRVERLREISEADAVAEGCQSRSFRDGRGVESARIVFCQLWDSINGRKPGHTWADSPWVWVLTFKRIAS